MLSVTALVVCLAFPVAAHAAGTLLFYDAFNSLDGWTPVRSVMNYDLVGWSIQSGRFASAPTCAGHNGYGPLEGSELWTKTPISLVGATSATLRFKTWYNFDPTPSGIDNMPTDVMTVHVQTDELDEWGWRKSYQLAEYAGSSGGWVTMTLDLTPYVGRQIDLYFMLTSASDVDEYWFTNGGVFVDDVEVWKDGIGTIELPKPSVGTPKAPSSVKKGRSYKVYGYLKPLHAAGSQPVRIYKWHKEAGAWKKRGYVVATVADYSSYSKYSCRMKLDRKGTWRIKAYHPNDGAEAARWSSHYDVIKVK